MDKIFKSVPLSATKGKGDNLIFTISTNTPDRDEDILEPKGAQLKNYKKNSVVLFAHDYHSLPIGKSVNIQTMDDHIEAEVEFAPTQFAQEVRTLCEQGFLSAASVGFIPIESEPIEEKNEDDELTPYRGRRYKKWDLLEWSIVPVPSNFEALIQNAKAKGLNVDAVKEELLKGEKCKHENMEEVTSHGDEVKVFICPDCSYRKTEPFEDVEENKITDAITIGDSDQFTEIRISEKMLEKLVVDGVPFAEKSGRVLSTANEKKIRSARDSLSSVLDQLNEQDEDDKSPSFEELIERLETAIGMLMTKNNPCTVMPVDDEGKYLEIHTPEPDIGISVEDVKEMVELVRDELRKELRDERTTITGKVE